MCGGWRRSRCGVPPLCGGLGWAGGSCFLPSVRCAWAGWGPAGARRGAGWGPMAGMLKAGWLALKAEGGGGEGACGAVCGRSPFPPLHPPPYSRTHPPHGPHTPPPLHPPPHPWVLVSCRPIAPTHPPTSPPSPAPHPCRPTTLRPTRRCSASRRGSAGRPAGGSATRPSPSSCRVGGWGWGVGRAGERGHWVQLGAAGV